MQRGSSVNFQPLKSALHAVSHSSRTAEPGYLLPPERSLGTIIVLNDRGSVAKTLELKMALASRQALAAKNFSPLWEGVLNLRRPEPDEDEALYKLECKEVVQEWCAKYEAMTGHKVLRADVHLDEGHIVEGVTMLNAHAHIMADKTNEKGRLLKLTPQKLRELQTITAAVTNLERGVNSRMSGKKHITAHQYKYLAERGNLEVQKVKAQLDALTVVNAGELDKAKSDLTRQRKLSKEWSDADLAKVRNLQAKLDGEPERLAAALKAQEAQLNEQYRSDREALKKGAEKAQQADYQALKKAHEADLVAVGKAHAEQLEALKTKLDKAETEAAKVPDLVDLVEAKDGEIFRVKTKAVEIIGPLREEVETLKTQITQLETNKAQPAAQAAHLIDTTGVAADTASRTSQSNPLTPDPVVPLGPNARARLRAEQMALEASKQAQEPPKQPEAPAPSPATVKSLVERIQDWVKGLIEQFGKQPSELAEGDYVGKVIAVMDGAWAQKVSREGDWVVHQGQAPALESIVEVTFKGGESKVKGMEKSGKGGIGR